MIHCAEKFCALGSGDEPAGDVCRYKVGMYHIQGKGVPHTVSGCTAYSVGLYLSECSKRRGVWIFSTYRLEIPQWMRKWRNG